EHHSDRLGLRRVIGNASDEQIITGASIRAADGRIKRVVSAESFDGVLAVESAAENVRRIVADDQIITEPADDVLDVAADVLMFPGCTVIGDVVQRDLQAQASRRAVELIDSGSAVDDVVAAVGFKGIVAGASGGLIRACAADERAVAAEGIVAITAVEVATAGDVIVAGVSIDVTIFAVDV